MENIIEERSVSLEYIKKKPKDIMKEGHLDQPISVIMTQDVWVRTFMHECCDLYGMPCVAGVCMSKTDRFKYAFSLMSVSTSMRRMDDVWKSIFRKIS